MVGGRHVAYGNPGVRVVMMRSQGGTLSRYYIATSLEIAYRDRKVKDTFQEEEAKVDDDGA